MITVKFFTDNQGPYGFEVSGHAGYAEEGSDIVCAAVSSAVNLCECAITDVIGAAAKISADEKTATVSVILSDKCDAARDMISALMIYLAALRDDYSQYIDVLEV